LSTYDDKLKELFNSKNMENCADSTISSINAETSNKKSVVIDENTLEQTYNPVTKIKDNDVDDIDENDLVSSKDIQFVLDTIAKQAPYDKIQIKQIFYGICSSQTSTKIHHNINSKKSGDGKSFILKLVSDLFPDSFILKFINMSDKALYHQEGFEAIKNEKTGEYEELKPILKEIETEIEDLEEKIEKEEAKGQGQQKDKQLIRSYKKQIREKNEECKDLKARAVKIIDLDDKAFIFLDTPNEGLFNNLMSLLSQDSRDQLYIFTDKDSAGKRLQTRSVLLRGCPLIMSTQVVDDTRNYRFAEKNRRFVHANPNTDENKIQEALRQITIKLSGVSDDFECIVLSEDIKKSKKIVEGLCKKLYSHNQKFLENGITGNAVKIPFSSILYDGLSKSDSWSMTVLNRLLNYIAIITKVNMDSRPRIVDTETGVFYPISIYDDLKEALEIMKTASLSIRPYQQEWYINIFLPAFDELDSEPNCKISEYSGNIIAKESVVGLTAKQLADKMNKQGMKISNAKIYENYLRPLKEQGVINSVQSVLNGKEYLYYPVNIDDENDSSISILPLIEDCRLILSQSFDEKKVLEESLETLSRRRRNGGEGKYKIIDVDGAEISINDLLERYFFNETYYTSCAVVLTKYHNNSIEQYSMVEEQTKDVIIENLEKLDEENEISKQEAIKKSYECYYCDEFAPTDNRDDYEKHVVLSHDGKLAYPSLSYLEKNNLKSQEKKWEI
jgi:hypothetical protein